MADKLEKICVKFLTNWELLITLSLTTGILFIVSENAITNFTTNPEIINESVKNIIFEVNEYSGLMTALFLVWANISGIIRGNQRKGGI